MMCLEARPHTPVAYRSHVHVNPLSCSYSHSFISAQNSQIMWDSSGSRPFIQRILGGPLCPRWRVLLAMLRADAAGIA